MPAADSETAFPATYESLRNRTGMSTRARPPNLDLITGDEHRVPLRPERLDRRESRLGLRSIFGRSKAAKEVQPPPEPVHHGSIRESVLDVGGVPYEHMSEASLSPHYSSRPLSITLESPGPGQIARHEDTTRGKKKGNNSNPTKQGRNAVAEWDCPPLFKAYPQAVRQATLPASTMPADTIVRLHEKLAGLNTHQNEDFAEDYNTEKGKETVKGKKKHRRDTSLSSLNLDWTTKNYILTTSGHLLQYSGDGPFNRLPEKVLRLGKTSAAFASDMIPGRHWVLHVSSAAELDGTPSSDSRSLFSRLTFRNTDRRSASNFLMVFEGAEDLEAWIITLRREIEQLGGKRSLSETGKPKADDVALPLRERPSQRTLVVRDPDRFSRSVYQDLTWERDLDMQHQSDGGLTVTDAEMAHDQSLDDTSTTNSIVSTDGRQLDALRDSGNRFSAVSSDQPTVVTSAGSSPACSPTQDSFPTHLEDPIIKAEARPRPNAYAIVDRRRSMQTMSPYSPLTEFNGESAALAGGHTSISAAASQAPSFNMGGTEILPRTSSRKSPPTSLRLARPLSMVVDQPSPRESLPERPVTRHEDARSLLHLNGRPLPQPRACLRNRPPMPRPELPSARSSPMPAESNPRLSVRRSPRRLSSLNELRVYGGAAPQVKASGLPDRVSELHSFSRPPPRGTWSERPERCRSSMDLRDDEGNRTAPKRSSMYASPLGGQAARYSMVPDGHVPPMAEPPPLLGPPPSMPLPAIPSQSGTSHLRVNLPAKALFNRRSMPQLAQGLPRAPPPTCALPPLPRKPLGRHESVAVFDV